MHITHMIHATETTSNTLPILWKKLTVCEIVLALHEWERITWSNMLTVTHLWQFYLNQQRS